MISGILLVGFLAPLITATSNYPNLTLPWGTYQAKPLENKPDIYIFQNVRFGGVPTRFGSSAYPESIVDSSILQDNTYGPSCIQVDVKKLRNPPGGRIGIGNPEAGPGATDLPQSEDCLFLDIYVPVSAFRSSAPTLPVVVWFFGGAYAFGSKLPYGTRWPFYTGQALLESSNNNVIYVAGNYRLGAFGWLAGTYMEEEGLPNAGLYDQRLLLQWVQKYISKVNGNPSDVSAWGESAGAGSILHHLVQKRWQDPLFSKALLQSPAFEWQWDREGTLNEVYKNFSSLASCGRTFNISCLRNASTEMLKEANQALFKSVPQTGLFPLGPSVDRALIEELPAISFANGAYRSLKSIVVSHVGDESGSFVPSFVVDNRTFEQFLHSFMPEERLAGVRSAIRAQYNCSQPPYDGNYTFCVSMLIRDSTFTCNTRQLYDAYRTKAYMMQYSFPAGGSLGLPEAKHATDLVPTFANSKTNLVALLKEFSQLKDFKVIEAAILIKDLMVNYQKYLASYAVHGDPNVAKGFDALPWDLASGTGNMIQSVLRTRYKPLAIHPFFEIIEDSINTKQSCDFWTAVAMNISKVPEQTRVKGSLIVQRPGNSMKPGF